MAGGGLVYRPGESDAAALFLPSSTILGQAMHRAINPVQTLHTVLSGPLGSISEASLNQVPTRLITPLEDDSILY